MTNAKNTPARKAPAKRVATKKSPAKKATAKKPAAKKAPAKKVAPKTAAAQKPAAKTALYSDKFERAFTFITGKSVDDVKPNAVAPYLTNWQHCRCEEMNDGMGLAVLFAAAIHGSLAIRLLRKATGEAIEGGMSDDLLAAVNAADQSKLLREYSAWVMRRAAFAPQGHTELFGWSSIIIKIVQHVTSNLVTLELKVDASAVKQEIEKAVATVTKEAQKETGPNDGDKGGDIDAATEALGDGAPSDDQAGDDASDQGDNETAN